MIAFLHSLDSRPNNGNRLSQETGTERGAAVRTTNTFLSAKRKNARSPGFGFCARRSHTILDAVKAAYLLVPCLKRVPTDRDELCGNEVFEIAT